MAPDSGESKHPLGTMCNDYFSKITGEGGSGRARRRSLHLHPPKSFPWLASNLCVSASLREKNQQAPPTCSQHCFTTDKLIATESTDFFEVFIQHGAAD